MGKNDSDADSTSANAEEPMRIPVGTLQVVQQDEGFVLVRSTRFLQPEPGTKLIAIGNGGLETAQLQVSPARKGQFMTADIVFGNPQVGDQVLMDYEFERQAEANAPSMGMGAGEQVQVLE